MLIDQATIFVRSGKGGDGCLGFRREKFIPKGGPDGGDGGRGGDVILVCDPALTTLLSLTPRPHYRATKGQQGMGKSMHGADGDDRVVAVPPGTLVYDRDSGDLLADITDPGTRYVAAAGGKGGFGNEHFKSATHQTPRETTPGGPAIDRVLRLELKLIADVGLIGKPNAGKSTLLGAVTRAQPKVADYPFTTRAPHLGIATLPSGGGERRLVIADLPGLIDGAAAGAGLGHDFLRHVERTKVLVHVVDVSPIDGSDPVETYEAIRRELFDYSVALAEKPEVLLLNKIDLVPGEERERRIDHIVGRLGLTDGEAVCVGSGATAEGTRELLESVWRVLDQEEAPGWSSAYLGDADLGSERVERRQLRLRKADRRGIGAGLQQQQRAQRGDGLAHEGADLKAVVACGAERGEAGGEVASRGGARQLGGACVGDQPEALAHRLGVQLPIAVGGELIEQADGVAQGTGTAPRRLPGTHEIPVPGEKPADALQRVVVRLARANSNGLLDIGYEDLAITDLAGFGSNNNCFDHALDLIIGNGRLDFRLGQKIHDVLGTTVQLRVTALSAEALDLRHGHAVDALLVQGVADVVQAKRFDDGRDQFHRGALPSWRRKIVYRLSTLPTHP